MNRFKRYLVLGIVAAAISVSGIGSGAKEQIWADGKGKASASGSFQSETSVLVPDDGKYSLPKKTDAAKKGLIRTDNGIYYLKKNGSKFTGFKKINSKLYYFGTDGRRYEKKGWLTLGKKTYYFQKNHAAATGLRKIGKYYYLFNSKGVLLKEKTVEGKVTYYVDLSGHVQGYSRGKKYFEPDGDSMNAADGYEMVTYQTACMIASKLTTSKMTDSQKLWACFEWVVKKNYENHFYDIRETNWVPLYANDHFLSSGGTCLADACAFAYLAKALGYKKVYVCLDTKIEKYIPETHGWTEINGLVYDPLFYQSKGRSLNYWGGYYKDYPLYPLTKIRLS